MVKQKATERRERRWTKLPTIEDFSPSAQQDRPDQVMGGTGGGNPAPSEDDSATMSSTSSSMFTSGVTGSETSPSQGETTPASCSSPPTSGEVVANPLNRAVYQAVDSFPENKSEMEVTFTMIYLDYVVPFLFPFYRPCLLESSRGWMLVLLMKNRALFHTALSLANWLYAVVLDNADGAHGACKRANWVELQGQQEIAIKALHEDIAALNARGVANAFREAISCMQSIIQLLEFEVAIANTENWPCHHDAAVALFDQIITHHADHSSSDATTTTPTPWHSILDRIGLGFRRIPIRPGRHVLTPDQSAYRFYTAYLLYIDIIAATAMGVVPRLQKYHAELLSGDMPIIRLNEYVGCYSWAMVELAAVAELAAWKREQQTHGSLSMVELVHRACAIGARIHQRMDTLDETVVPVPAAASRGRSSAVDNVSIDDPSGYPPVTPFSGGFHDMVAESEAQAAPAMALHTRIWAQATLTYLAIITSGLNPALPEIQTSVQATIELFRALPSPLALRTLVWPFAVTGCVALPEQQAFFVQLVDDMGGMKIFGTVKEALRIMQNIWEHRGDCFLDPQMCDIATCFSLLGHCSLLV